MISKPSELKRKQLRLSVNWHGFNRLGGLQLGVAVGYPFNGLWILKVSFVVGTLTVTIK